MIFRNHDEAFALQAADTTLRPGLIRGLSRQRTITCVIGLVLAGIALLCSETQQWLFLVAAVFFVSSTYTDGQIKLLKTLDRLSSNQSLQGTQAERLRP